MTRFSDWMETSKNSPPLGYLLRERFSENWFRIHSLTNSKRYPESEEEKRELIFRNQTVAKEVLGEGKIAIFISVYSEERLDNYSQNNLTMDLNLEKVFSFNIADEEDDEESFLNVFESELSFSDELYSEIILAVAFENIGPVVFFSPEESSAVSPYDGGADVFLFKSAGLRSMKSKFLPWSSNREDGL